MVAIQDSAEEHIYWVLRSGACNFWFDNWLGTGPLSQRLESVSDHRVKDFVVNGNWDCRLLFQWVPPDVCQEIMEVAPPSSSEQDLPVWKLSSSGDFAVSSVYEIIQ